MSEIYSAIADATRRQILSALAAKPATVSDLVALTGAEQPAVSKHLKALREANLVTVEAQGQARIYALNAAPLADVSQFVSSLGVAGATAASAKPEAGTDELQEILGDAGQKIGGWLSAGATWLNSQLQEQLSKVDVDPQKLGKDLGRKLADAKAAAADVASEVEAGIREDAQTLKEKVTAKFGGTDASAASPSETPAAPAKAAPASKLATPVVAADLDEDEF